MRRRSSPPPHLLLGAAFLPEDFPERLNRFKEVTGLSWEGLAMCMGVDPRQLQRWRQGTKPCGDALFALFRLADCFPGGVRLLLREDGGPPEGTAPPLWPPVPHAQTRRSRPPSRGLLPGQGSLLER